MKVKFVPVWNDVRQSVFEYTAEELLKYYRAARWYTDAAQYSKLAESKTNVALDICSVVDETLDAMRSISDYRMAVTSEILRCEYCLTPQLDTADRIARSNLSRSTYYLYLKNGLNEFSELYESMKPLYMEVSE